MLSKTKKLFSKAKNGFQEKRLPFFFLLFIIFSLSIPWHNVKAASPLTLISPIFALPEIIKNIGSALNPAELAFMFIYAVVYEVSVFILYVASLLVTLGAYLIDAMLQPQIYSIVLNINNPNSAIMTGWTVIRDMGNTFFVLLLLIIAFSTILRIQQYSARNVLPKFIIVLFLMNFSAVFAGIVIDFGQVFMYEIRNWMGAFGSNTGAMGSLTSFVDSEFAQFGIIPPDGGFSLENAAGAFFAGIFTLVMGAAYIMLAGFLLIRLVAFAILIVLSPAAILGLVMPGLHSISSEWWKKLWEYSVFGPLFIFFVFLAAQMASALKGYDPSVYDPALGSEKLGGLSYLAVLLVPYAVSLGMLYAVIPLTKRLGIAGASMLIGGTMGFGKILMGTYMAMKIPAMAGKKIAQETDKRTGRRMSDWGRTQKEKVLKRLGGYGKGKILEDQAKMAKERDEEMKKIEVEYGHPKDINIELLKQKADSRGATVDVKAFLLKVAAERGKLGERDNQGNLVYGKYLKAAEKSMSKTELEKITNKNLSLYAGTGEAKKKATEAGAGNYSSFSDETAEKLRAGKITAEEGVMRDKMADIVREGEAHKVQGLNNKLDNKVWHESQTADQRKSSMDRMAKDQRNELAKGYMQNTYQTDAAYSSASEEEKRRDMEYRINAVKLGKGLEESFTRGGNIIGKEIEEAFSKLSSRDIAKLDIKDVEKYGYKTSSSQIKSLNRAGEYETISVIRRSKENRLSGGVKMGAIGGIKSMVDYNKAKSDLETAKNNLDREIKIGGDPARIDRLRKTVQGLEAKLKPFSEIEKDIETIDDSLTGKSY